MDHNIVKALRVYWARISDVGAIQTQNGPGALTVGLAVSVYTITMPANFTVPVNRRTVTLTLRTAGAAAITYDEAASANNTVVVRTFTSAGAAADFPFTIEIWRVEFQIGAGAG